MKENIYNAINILIAILAIFIGLISPKIYEKIKNKSLTKYKGLGYNQVLYDSGIIMVVILPFCYFIINFITYAFLLQRTNYWFLTLEINFIISIFTYVYCYNKSKKRIQIMKMIDKENIVEQYKFYKIRFHIVKIYCIVVYVLTFIMCISVLILNDGHAVSIYTELFGSILLFQLLLMIVYVCFSVFLTYEKATIKTRLCILVDYTTFYKCYVRIIIKDNSILKVCEDSIKIYVEKDNILYSIDKSRVYEIKTEYKMEFTDKYKKRIEKKQNRIKNKSIEAASNN